MTDKEALQRYVDLVPFLSSVLGPGTEVVIHDIKHPDKSLVAIANPLSGREIGSPMTDFAQNIVEQGMHTDKDFFPNYNGKSKGVDFLSSTYLIKNNDKLIGLLCINKNLAHSRKLTNAMAELLTEYNLQMPEKSIYQENLDTNVNDFVESRIAQLIAHFGIEPEKLSSKEKANIVKKLDESGILKVKGAVNEAARLLSVSVPTIYRYMKNK